MSYCTLERKEGEMVCSQCGFRMRERERMPRVRCRAGNAELPPQFQAVHHAAQVVLRESDLPCQHRAGPPHLRECRPCVAAGRVPLVWACAIHGQCSLGTFGWRGVTSCLTCDDREPPAGADEGLGRG